MQEMKQTITLPDLGGATDVQIIEILVQEGAHVQAEQPILVLEGDKATMEVPAPFAGVLTQWHVQVGDTVNSGDTVATASTQAEEKETEKQDDIAPPTVEAVAHEVAIELPDLGGAHDVAVIEVLVASGDVVTPDQALLVLEGDKATMEVPATDAGTIVSLCVKVGDVVNAGDRIGTLRKAQAAAASPTPPPASKPPMPEVAPPEVAQPNNGALLYAGPSVRRLAFEFGVDLTQVRASGPKGRLLKEDLQAHVKARLQTSAQGAALPSMPEVDFSAFGTTHCEPLNKIKQKTAAFLSRNAMLIPHVTQHEYVDITDLETMRQIHKKGFQERGARLTMLVFVIRALVESLKAFPHFNASLSPCGTTLIVKEYIHIGFACDTPDGLVVPVIRNVENLSVFELASQIVVMSEKARNGALTLTDMQGGCMTVSSLGGIGGHFFTPIVNAPEVAILAVSKATIQPHFVGEAFTPRLMLPLSLSYDHRVIDGADGARFIVHFSEALKNQATLCCL